MGAKASTKKTAQPLTEEEAAQFAEDLQGVTVEDKTTFEEDDDPLSLAGDFVDEDDSEDEGKQ